MFQPAAVHLNVNTEPGEIRQLTGFYWDFNDLFSDAMKEFTRGWRHPWHEEFEIHFKYPDHMGRQSHVPQEKSCECPNKGLHRVPLRSDRAK